MYSPGTHWVPSANSEIYPTNEPDIGRTVSKRLYEELAPNLADRKAALEQTAVLSDLSERHKMGLAALQKNASQIQNHLRKVDPALNTAKNFSQAAEKIDTTEEKSWNSTTLSTSPGSTATLSSSSTNGTSSAVSPYSFHKIVLDFENPLYAEVLNLRAQALAEEDTLALLLQHYCTVQEEDKASSLSAPPEGVVESLVRDSQERGRKMFLYKFQLHRLLRHLHLPIEDDPPKPLTASSPAVPSPSQRIASPSASSPSLSPDLPKKKAGSALPFLSATAVCPSSSKGKVGKKSTATASASTAAVPPQASSLSPKSALKVAFPQASEKMIEKVLNNCNNDVLAAKIKLQSLSSS